VESYLKQAQEAHEKAKKARELGDYLQAVKYEEEAVALEEKAHDPGKGEGMSQAGQVQIRKHILFLRRRAKDARINGDVQKALQLDQEADRLQARLLH